MIRFLAVVMIVLTACSKSRADFVFTDTTFQDGNWTQSILSDSAGGGVSSSFSNQIATGGSPSAFRRSNITFPYTFGSVQGVFVGHVASSALYNPSVDGEIGNLSFTIDYNLLSQSGGTPGAHIYLLLRQGSSVYLGPGLQTIGTAGNWTTFSSTSVLPSDFQRRIGSGSSLPDFSSRGGAIEFGYAISVGAGSGPSSTIVTNFGVDNYSLMITTVPHVVTRGTRYIGATGAGASTSLATDKFALLPGQTSTFANYTNYDRGLNGIVVDVNGLPSGTTNAQMLASLQFASWDGIAAGGFVALPGTVVPTVAIADGAGAGGSARVTIAFPDNAVQNTWLRVTVLSNANTGLAANDVFYFGNVIGDFDAGNTTTRIRVNALDTSAVRNNQATGANSASVTNIYDVNRDGRVNALDTSIVRNNQQTSGIVAPITAP